MRGFKWIETNNAPAQVTMLPKVCSLSLKIAKYTGTGGWLVCCSGVHIVSEF